MELVETGRIAKEKFKMRGKGAGGAGRDSRGDRMDCEGLQGAQGKRKGVERSLLSWSEADRFRLRLQTSGLLGGINAETQLTKTF